MYHQIWFFLLAAQGFRKNDIYVEVNCCEVNDCSRAQPRWETHLEEVVSCRMNSCRVLNSRRFWKTTKHHQCSMSKTIDSKFKCHEPSSRVRVWTVVAFSRLPLLVTMTTEYSRPATSELKEHSGGEERDTASVWTVRLPSWRRTR